MSDELSILREFLAFSSYPKEKTVRLDPKFDNIANTFTDLYLNTPIFQQIYNEQNKSLFAQLLNYMFFLQAYLFEQPKEAKNPSDDNSRIYELSAAHIILKIFSIRSQAVINMIQSSTQAVGFYLNNQASPQLIQIESTALVRELIQIQPFSMFLDMVFQKHPYIGWVSQKDTYNNVISYGQNLMQYFTHIASNPPSNQYVEVIQQYQTTLIQALQQSIAVFPRYIQAIEAQFDKDPAKTEEKKNLSDLMTSLFNILLEITWNSIETMQIQPQKVPELIPWLSQYYFGAFTKGYGAVRKLYATGTGADCFQQIADGLNASMQQLNSLIEFLQGLIQSQSKTFKDTFINPIVATFPQFQQVVEISSKVLQDSVNSFNKQQLAMSIDKTYPPIDNIENSLYSEDPIKPVIHPFIEACHDLVLALTNHSDYEQLIKAVNTQYNQIRSKLTTITDINEFARVNVICDLIDTYWPRFVDDFSTFAQCGDGTSRLGFIGSTTMLLTYALLLGSDYHALKVMKFAIDLCLSRINQYFANLDPINAIINQYIQFVNQQVVLIPTGTASIAVYSLAQKAQSAIAQYTDFTEITNIMSALYIVDQIWPTFECCYKIFQEHQVTIDQLQVGKFIAPLKLFCNGIALYRRSLTILVQAYLRVSSIIGLRSMEEAITVGDQAAQHTDFDISQFVEVFKKSKEELPKELEPFNRNCFVLNENTAKLREELNGIFSISGSIKDGFVPICDVAYGPQLSSHIGAAIKLSDILDFGLLIAHVLTIYAKLLVKPVIGPALNGCIARMQQSASAITQHVQDCNRYIFQFAYATLEASSIMRIYPGLEQYASYANDTAKQLFIDLFNRYTGEDKLQETYNTITNVYNQLQALVPFIKDQYNLLRAKMIEDDISPPAFTGEPRNLPQFDFTPAKYDYLEQKKKREAEEKEQEKQAQIDKMHKEEEERKKRADEERKKKEEEEEKKRKEEAERKKKEEEERKKKEEEERKRKEEERKKKEEEERKRREEEERRRKEEEERRRREEEERIRREQEEKKRREEERRRREEEEARRKKEEEEERKRVEQERIRAFEEQKRKIEEDRLRAMQQEQAILDSFELLMKKLQEPNEGAVPGRPQEINDIRRYVDTLKALINRLGERPDNMDIPKSMRVVLQALSSALKQAESNAKK